MEDRSSRPRRSPNQTPVEVEELICELRRARRWGPHRIAYALEMPRSTVERVLRRRGLSRLDAIDAPTRRIIRRYERATPGELIHVDVKKLGRIPHGGGWRIHGLQEARARRVKRGMGYDFVHVAIDDHSRVVYVEALDDEQGDTCAGFISRAIDWFSNHQVTVERVMTDNAWNYRRSRSFQQALGGCGVRHITTRPYRPQTNGKPERFNRPSSKNGHTTSPTHQTRHDSKRSPPGYTTTTGIDSTPKSERHQPAGYPSTTSVGRTTRRRTPQTSQGSLNIHDSDRHSMG